MEHALPILVFTLLVIDWLIRISFIIYVPRGRKPTAAMAWLLTIFIVPIFGALLFFAIGSPKLSKRRRQQQQSIDALIESATRLADDVPPHLSTEQQDRYASTIQQNKKFGKMPAVSGNTMVILDTYQSIIDDTIVRINQAQQRIYMQYFIIALDSTTEPLFAALHDAASRGVEVYVLFDAVGSSKYKNFKKMKRRLTSMGVHWQAMLPIRLRPGHYNRPDLRNHRKIVVIDDVYAYLGSFNLIDSAYQRKDDIVYEELVVRMSGPIVRQCAAIFAGDWFSETGDAPSALMEQISQQSTTGTLAQLLPSGPTYEHENNLKLFVSLLYTAKKRVVITNPYFVPDDALLTAVVTAINRGVDVILINSKAKDQWMVGHAQRSYYEELLRIGVVIYLHNTPVLLHSKHMTVDDDIAVIGSSNMDIRSFQLNMECVVIAYDPAVVKQLVAIQQKNIDNAHPITLATWQRRSLRQSFLDSVARLTAALQ